MSYNDALDFREEHQLFSKATDKTHQYIGEAKEELTRDQSKPKEKKSTKDKDAHDVPLSEKIQKPKSDLGLSDLFE